MKNLTIIILTMTVGPAYAQSVIGTWQLTEDKPCVARQFEESETEKELLQSFGSSDHSIAKVITFNAKGKGEESIFSTGKKKGADKESFRYQIQGGELQFIDKKSGVITERFALDELTSSTMRFHRVGRDCEMRSFIKVK